MEKPGCEDGGILGPRAQSILEGQDASKEKGREDEEEKLAIDVGRRRGWLLFRWRFLVVNWVWGGAGEYATFGDCKSSGWERLVRLSLPLHFPLQGPLAAFFSLWTPTLEKRGRRAFPCVIVNLTLRVDMTLVAFV